MKEAIRRHREARGLTQGQLAKKMGLYKKMSWDTRSCVRFRILRYVPMRHLKRIIWRGYMEEFHFLRSFL